MSKKYEKFFSWRAAVLNSNLPPTARHILLTLSCHMNDAGESCHPSIATLCRETGLSKRAVIAHLIASKNMGWISVGKLGFSGQRWANNDYRISWPPEPEGGAPDAPPFDLEIPEGGAPDAPPCDTKVVHVATEGGARSDRKVVHHVHTSTPVNSPRVLQCVQSKRHSNPAPEVEPPPPGLDETAWQRWVEYRREIRKPLKPASILAAQRKLAAFGKDQAAVVEQSIADGYQGLFALKPGGRYATRKPTDNSAIGQIRAANQRARQRETAERGNTSAAVGTHGDDLRVPLEGQFRHER